MILSIVDNLTSGVQDFFYHILWNIIKTILMVIDEIAKAFRILTGLEGVPVKTNGITNGSVSLLEALFGITRDGGTNKFKYEFNFDSPIHQAYKGMFYVFSILFVFCIICSIIKISMNKQDKEAMPSMGKLLWKSLQCLGIVLILPLFISLMIGMTGLIMGYVDENIRNNLIVHGDSLGISLFKSNISIPNGELGDDLTYTISWEQFKEQIGINNFNFFLCLLTSCCCLVGIVMASIF